MSFCTKNSLCSKVFVIAVCFCLVCAVHFLVLFLPESRTIALELYSFLEQTLFGFFKVHNLSKYLKKFTFLADKRQSILKATNKRNQTAGKHFVFLIAIYKDSTTILFKLLAVLIQLVLLRNYDA